MELIFRKIMGRIKDSVLNKLISAQCKDWLKHTGPSESVEDPLQRASMKELHCVIFLLSGKYTTKSKCFWKFKPFFYHIVIKIHAPKCLYKDTCKKDKCVSKPASYEKILHGILECIGWFNFELKWLCFRKKHLYLLSCHEMLPRSTKWKDHFIHPFQHISQIFLPCLVILGWGRAGLGCLFALKKL